MLSSCFVGDAMRLQLLYFQVKTPIAHGSAFLFPQ